MHESVGHPTELDRILGWEANMAGRSFIRPEDVGVLRYGSDAVNFTVDNALAGGVGSWFFDDDGVRMRRFALVKEGLLVNLGCTRETAPLVGWERSTGCCRSDGFEHFPINRIPNLYLEPGPEEGITPEDLIAGVDRGVYIEGLGSFSIDQMRNNFQFGGDLFWKIERGKKTVPLKKVTYQAQTRQFWGSCDGLAGAPFWQQHGVMNCGKGEPLQVMFMTHGASVARFRRINVGGARL
jgi:TldD protein